MTQNINNEILEIQMLQRNLLKELLPKFKKGAKIRNTSDTLVLKQIKGFPNYLVDNFGNVYNGLTNKKLKPFTNNKGYLMVDLQGKKKTIHRLVAIAFIENKNNKSQVNHIDGNKKKASERRKKIKHLDIENVKLKVLLKEWVEAYPVVAVTCDLKNFAKIKELLDKTNEVLE